MTNEIRSIAVLTGDHGRPDPTKPGQRYNPEDLEQHRVMVEAMRSIPGYAFSIWTDHAAFVAAVAKSPPDLVINFCDTGYLNRPDRELTLPAYLDMLAIPYSGAPPQAMVLCYDKAVVRLVAEAMGVAVPRELFLPADAGPSALPDLYPALIKPNTADGSLGITKDAVVRTPEEARRYLAWLHEALPGRDVLVQEYLPGPEYGIGLIGNPGYGLTVLPPLEVDYSRLPAGLNPILSYESKSDPNSPYWTEIGFRRAGIAPHLEERMTGWCRTLFRRLGLRDCGRFDFRVAADGTPRLMEVNPNPAWDYTAKLAIMASFADIDYAGMLAMIVEAAAARVRGGGAL